MGKCGWCRRLQQGGEQSTGSRLQYCSITQSETVDCSTADTSPNSALLLTPSGTISTRSYIGARLVFMLLLFIFSLQRLQTRAEN